MYLTGNPIGSTDARDLVDNAETLDQFLLSPEAEHTDRLNVTHKTLAGMRLEVRTALDSISYQILGDYATGLVVQNFGQVFRKDGEFYRADAELALPYELTGDWAAEAANFVSVGDAILRGELAGSDGSRLIGYLARTAYDKLADSINVMDFVGAIGDGLADDTAPLLSAIAHCEQNGKALWITEKHRVTQKIVARCDILCSGKGELIFDVDLLNGFSLGDAAFVVGRTSWPRNRFIGGLSVQPSARNVANNAILLRVNDPYAHLVNCKGSNARYGIAVATYGVKLSDCKFTSNGINLVAFKSSGIDEINSLTIDGGDYTTPAGDAAIIGDETFWPDDGTGSPHGVNINICGGASFDGGALWIKNVFNVNINTYVENPNSGICIKVGADAGTIFTRGVVVHPSYFAHARYAIKAMSDRVDGIHVMPCVYRSITSSALYLLNDQYPFTYETAAQSIGSFAQGQEVHTGFRPVAMADVQFRGAVIPSLGINYGAQVFKRDDVNAHIASSLKIMQNQIWYSSHSGGRTHDVPKTAAGTQNGNIFTFATLAVCYAFNGGDRLSSTEFVRSVDYAVGTAVLSSSFTGAKTIAQQATVWRKEGVSSAAPSSGYWTAGDFIRNNRTASSAEFGWVCTVSGAPGTWAPVVSGGGITGTRTIGGSSVTLINGCVQSIA